MTISHNGNNTENVLILYYILYNKSMGTNGTYAHAYVYIYFQRNQSFSDVAA